MTISTEQARAAAKAKAIQTRRAASGKRGYAKAVHRLCKRAGGDYRSNLNGLPVNWDAKPVHVSLPARGRAA